MAEFMTPAGSEMAVSAALPATEDVAGYEALNFTDLPIASEFGEFGPTDNIVTFIPVQGSAVQKAQGSRDFGAQTVPFAYVRGDAGIAILETAWESRAKLSVRTTLPNGDIRYYQAVCDGVREQVGAADTVLGMTTTLHITSQVIKDDAS